jgi:AcrR family transcriptional regulator
MRMLASQVGVQPAALYRYFPTKQDLLFQLMRDHMETLLASWQASDPAGLTADASSVTRLAAYVRHHISFHVERRHATQVNNMELRALSREHLSLVLKLRSAYEKHLRRILRDGHDDGDFAIHDIALTATAIIQMITGVIVWFRPDERLSVEQVTQSYHIMTMRLVGADPATFR